jgi:hypothetical protein
MSQAQRASIRQVVYAEESTFLNSQNAVEFSIALFRTSFVKALTNAGFPSIATALCQYLPSCFYCALAF